MKSSQLILFNFYHYCVGHFFAIGTKDAHCRVGNIILIIILWPPARNQANDLNELKKLQKPSDVIKLIFDCVGLLKMEKVQPVQVDEITIGIGKEKQTLPFLKVHIFVCDG